MTAEAAESSVADHAIVEHAMPAPLRNIARWKNIRDLIPFMMIKMITTTLVVAGGGNQVLGTRDLNSAPSRKIETGHAIPIAPPVPTVSAPMGIVAIPLPMPMLVSRPRRRHRLSRLLVNVVPPLMCLVSSVVTRTR
jgi:hypothetical protein